MADKDQHKDQQKLSDIAKRYPDSFLLCRDTGHQWQPTEAMWLQDGGIERVLACSQCEAQRVQTLDRNGYITGGHYVYADGYRFVGLGRIDQATKALLRKTNMGRLFK
jgi:hypothetical protein